MKGCDRHFRLQVIAVSDDGTEQLEELADLVRCEATLETLGMTLAESKQVLQELQRIMIGQQVDAYLDEQRACSDFSDGGDTVRRLPQYLNPNSEHILDWFHITMKITVLQQCAGGLVKPKALDSVAETAADEGLEHRLESVKHYLWHGNSAKALDRLQDVADGLECWDCDETGEKQVQAGSDSAARMLKYVRELETYIANNAAFIVNYGERYRNGERISTSFTESAINQVVSKRMVKRQQMQWTPEGAHLLLQVRIQVLNEDWVDTFRSWYPHFRPIQTPDTAMPLAA